MLPRNRASKELLRSAYLLYIALLLGQVLLSFVIIFMLTQPGSTLNEGSAYPFLALLVIFFAAGAAWYVNKLRQDQIPILRPNFEGKLLHYRTSIAMRSAMVEAGNLFCLVMALFERSLMPFLFFWLGLVVFLYFRPQLKELVALYQLNGEEQRLVEQYLKNR